MTTDAFTLSQAIEAARLKMYDQSIPQEERLTTHRYEYAKLMWALEHLPQKVETDLNKALERYYKRTGKPVYRTDGLGQVALTDTTSRNVLKNTPMDWPTQDTFERRKPFTNVATWWRGVAKFGDISMDSPNNIKNYDEYAKKRNVANAVQRIAWARRAAGARFPRQHNGREIPFDLVQRITPLVNLSDINAARTLRSVNKASKDLVDQKSKFKFSADLVALVLTFMRTLKYDVITDLVIHKDTKRPFGRKRLDIGIWSTCNQTIYIVGREGLQRNLKKRRTVTIKTIQAYNKTPEDIAAEIAGFIEYMFNVDETEENPKMLPVSRWMPSRLTV